jgi:hypothetical protein
MNNHSDSLMMAVLGFVVGSTAVFCFSYVSMQERVKENTIKACGTCDERTKTCGEYTCTKEGWK